MLTQVVEGIAQCISTIIVDGDNWSMPRNKMVDLIGLTTSLQSGTVTKKKSKGFNTRYSASMLPKEFYTLTKTGNVNTKATTYTRNSFKKSAANKLHGDQVLPNGGVNKLVLLPILRLRGRYNELITSLLSPTMMLRYLDNVGNSNLALLYIITCNLIISGKVNDIVITNETQLDKLVYNNGVTIIDDGDVLRGKLGTTSVADIFSQEAVKQQISIHDGALTIQYVALHGPYMKGNRLVRDTKGVLHALRIRSLATRLAQYMDPEPGQTSAYVDKYANVDKFKYDRSTHKATGISPIKSPKGIFANKNSWLAYLSRLGVTQDSPNYAFLSRHILKLTANDIGTIYAVIDALANEDQQYAQYVDLYKRYFSEISGISGARGMASI